MIKVLFFANLREIAKVDSIEIALGDAAVVRDLLMLLSAKLPAELIESLQDETAMVSINHKYAGWDGILNDGDEVGILPPVSGG